MIVRRPLQPCSIASQSMARSQTCQNGLAHLPATNAKSIWVMPSPVIRFTNRWPKTSTTSSRPEPRMNSQLFSSKLPPREAGLERGWEIWGALSVAIGQPPNTCDRCRITNGTKRTTNTPATP